MRQSQLCGFLRMACRRKAFPLPAGIPCVRPRGVRERAPGKRFSYHGAFLALRDVLQHLYAAVSARPRGGDPRAMAGAARGERRNALACLTRPVQRRSGKERIRRPPQPNRKTRRPLAFWFSPTPNSKQRSGVQLASETPLNENGTGGIFSARSDNWNEQVCGVYGLIATLMTPSRRSPNSL